MTRDTREQLLANIRRAGLGALEDDVLDAFFRRRGDITFYPRPFTPFSLTGRACELNCLHCASHYLEHMETGDLYGRAVRLAKRGVRGLILSGGCDTGGSVPLHTALADALRVKRATGMRLSAHTGITGRERALQLSRFLDMALVDIVGSDETIREVYGLDKTTADYESTLKNLSDAGIPLAPHIIIGLHGGELRGEFTALRMAAKYHPCAVVLVVFIPTAGTPLCSAPKTRITDVAKVMVGARRMFDVPVSISCVRPGGAYRSLLDECAILCGIDRLAVPSARAYSVCSELGLSVRESDGCCSYPPEPLP